MEAQAPIDTRQIQGMFLDLLRKHPEGLLLDNEALPYSVCQALGIKSTSPEVESRVMSAIDGLIYGRPHVTVTNEGRDIHVPGSKGKSYRISQYKRYKLVP